MNARRVGWTGFLVLVWLCAAVQPTMAAPDDWRMQLGLGNAGEGVSLLLRAESPLIGVRDDRPGGRLYLHGDLLFGRQLTVSQEQAYSVTGGLVGVSVNMLGNHNPRQVGVMPTIWGGLYRIEREGVGSDLILRLVDEDDPTTPVNRTLAAGFVGLRFLIPAPNPDLGRLRVDVGFGTFVKLGMRFEVELDVSLPHGFAAVVTAQALGVHSEDSPEPLAQPDAPQNSGSRSDSRYISDLGGWQLLVFGVRYSF